MCRQKTIENFYPLFPKSENFERVIIGKVNASQSSEGGVKGPTNVREDLLFLIGATANRVTEWSCIVSLR